MLRFFILIYTVSVNALSQAKSLPTVKKFELPVNLRPFESVHVAGWARYCNLGHWLFYLFCTFIIFFPFYITAISGSQIVLFFFSKMVSFSLEFCCLFPPTSSRCFMSACHDASYLHSKILVLSQQLFALLLSCLSSIASRSRPHAFIILIIIITRDYY